jgi:hypothetical protein
MEGLCPNWKHGCENNMLHTCRLSHVPTHNQRIILLERRLVELERNFDQAMKDLEVLKRDNAKRKRDEHE